jgi:hypothetical protein
MTTAAPSTALATIQPASTDPERLALAGYLAGYRGLTREAYTLDLRQFTTWCRSRSLSLFSVRRPDIESFARHLEANGRARATVTRRLSTIAGFYKYAVEEELLDHSSAAHVRRPRVDYESHAVALDRNELGALLVAAGLGSLTRKGGKVVTIPLAPHCSGHRPSHRRAHRRAGLRGRRRTAAGPARRGAARPQGRSPRRDHQSRHPAHPSARIYYRSARCRSAAARRPRGRLPC